MTNKTKGKGELVELKTIRTKTTNISKAVQEVDVTDEPKVKDLLDNIKKAKRWVRQENDKYVEPAKEIIKRAKEQYGPILDEIEEAKKTLETKVNDHRREMEEAERKKAEQIAKRVKKGTMKKETAEKKMEDLKPVGKTYGGVTQRSYTKARVTDKSKVPLEYLEPDLPAIKRALQAGVEVPGAELYKDNGTSS